MTGGVCIKYVYEMCIIIVILKAQNAVVHLCMDPCYSGQSSMPTDLDCILNEFLTYNYITYKRAWGRCCASS